MGYPQELMDRLLLEGQTIGLLMRLGNDEQQFNLRIKGREFPNNLREFSLGAATALDSAGTGVSEIQDSANRHLIVPEHEDTLYQVFYGINPSYARVFRYNPANTLRGQLRVVPTVTGDTGYLTGRDSPYQTPSAMTELFTIRDMNPGFLGYHPFGAPASITIRLNFFVIRYRAVKVPVSEGEDRVITMGGSENLVVAPNWIRDN